MATESKQPDGQYRPTAARQRIDPGNGEAVRAFMLKSVTPVGVALAIGSFVLGFFINEVARKQAYETSFTQMAKRMDDISDKASKRVDDIADKARDGKVLLEVAAEKTSNARQEIEKIEKDAQKAGDSVAEIAKQVKKVQQDAQKAGDSVADIAKHVKTVEVFKLVDEKLNELVTRLANDQTFVKRVVELTFSPDLSGMYTPYYSAGKEDNGLITRAVAKITRKGDIYEIQWFDDNNKPGKTATVRYLDGKPGELSTDSFFNYNWGNVPQEPKVHIGQRGTVTGLHIWWNNGEHWVKTLPKDRP